MARATSLHLCDRITHHYHGHTFGFQQKIPAELDAWSQPEYRHRALGYFSEKRHRYGRRAKYVSSNGLHTRLTEYLQYSVRRNGLGNSAPDPFAILPDLTKPVEDPVGLCFSGLRLIFLMAMADLVCQGKLSLLLFRS